MFKALDPLTQLITIWCCYAVAKAEQEDDNWISSAEWDYILGQLIANSYLLPQDLSDNINNESWLLVKKITNPALSINVKENGTLEKLINSILSKIFNYYEIKKLFAKWESAYKALKRNYKELKDLFGAFDVKALDATYKDIKFNIQESKKAAKLAEKEAIKAQKEAIKATERERKEQEREAARLAKEEAQAAKLKEHRFKTSKGETFCQYCGRDSSWSSYDCDGRANGHNYVMMKKDNEWEPICNKCGGDRTYDKYSCG